MDYEKITLTEKSKSLEHTAANCSHEKIKHICEESGEVLDYLCENRKKACFDMGELLYYSIIFKEAERALNADPNSIGELKKIWKFEKRKDNTVIITGYKRLP